MLKFNQLDHSDIHRCSYILEQSFPSSWKELNSIFNNPFNKIWGVSKDEQLIGLVAMSVVLDEAEILTCAILPDYQRQGIAGMLLKYVFNELKSQNVATIFLEVDTTNFSAKNLYKKLGFQPVGLRKAYYSQPDGSYHDGLVMRLSFSN